MRRIADSISIIESYLVTAAGDLNRRVFLEDLRIRGERRASALQGLASARRRRRSLVAEQTMLPLPGLAGPRMASGARSGSVRLARP